MGTTNVQLVDIDTDVDIDIDIWAKAISILSAEIDEHVD